MTMKKILALFIHELKKQYILFIFLSMPPEGVHVDKNAKNLLLFNNE